MIAQKIKIKLYNDVDGTGDIVGTIELSYLDISKAVLMMEEFIRPAYHEINMPCSFRIESVYYDV